MGAGPTVVRYRLLCYLCRAACPSGTVPRIPEVQTPRHHPVEVPCPKSYKKNICYYFSHKYLISQTKLHLVPRTENTVFPKNIAPTLNYSTPRKILHTQILHFLHLNIIWSITHSRFSLNSTECCFFMVLTQFHVKYCCKNWHDEISQYSIPQK